MKKYLIPMALVASLGGNIYSISGGLPQAIATEQQSQNVEIQYRECTTSEMLKVKPFFEEYVLSYLNTKYSRNLTATDLRPINDMNIRLNISSPKDSQGVPIAGVPKCYVQADINAIMERTLKPAE
jgi:hypothetical protein